LLIELDETASRLQIDCSILSRTGEQEVQIRQKYPDLEKRIGQERQAKIDSIVLFNKYGDVDLRAPTSFRAGSFHDFDEIPKPTPTPSRRRSSSHMPTSPSHSTSPVLKGKASVTDLMFEMDEDEEDVETPLSSFKDKLAATNRSPEPATSTTASPWVEAQKSSEPLSSGVESAASPSPKAPGRPWGAAPLPSAKIGMKEIMEQAAVGRTSSLSVGLTVGSTSLPKSAGTGSLTGKISQKERKRQQQLQQTTKSSAIITPTSSSPAPTPSSPWQMVGEKPKPIARTASNNASAPQPILSGPKAPQMTMRQTIANSGPSGNDRSAWTGQPMTSPRNTQPSQSTEATRPTSSKSASTPRKQPTMAPMDSPGFAISDRPVAIQSVRHVPKPERNMSVDQRNLIDILSEQEVQKQEIRDFGAKRSLMEIQQEQEFQEWWDKESARIMEEEAAANAAKTKNKSGRGGRRRGRGGGMAGEGEAGGERKKMGNRAKGKGKERVVTAPTASPKIKQ
jgi:hypothetical protein